MHLSFVDWFIIVAMLGLLLDGVRRSNRHSRSVADFLAAGRSAGRYLVGVASGIASLGAITIVGNLEMNYIAGFAMSWWGMTTTVVILVVTLSGWVIYRFRETRCLTVAEFFERRYSRRFRIFAGLLCWVSGIINFGIFPGVGARFFISYCGLPPTLALGGVALPTFPLVMAVLLLLALYFVFNGGQVTVIVTDFLQGTFVNLVFVVVCGWLLWKVVSWDQIFTALAAAPQDASLINPFKTGHVEDFNFWYFLIGLAGLLYGKMSWQGTQAYNSSARSAHEAKMGEALGMWKLTPQNLFLMFVPIVIYTVLNHPDFAPLADRINAELALVDRETIRSQLRAPLVLVSVLPHGLLGAFAAVMLAAFISTHDTYLHSWGSIFVQDVLLPWRGGQPLSQTTHLRVLRLSILGVAVFIYVFSLLFQQNQYIFLFFAITGAIFVGGSGAVIIGGLYWRRGTTAAAWSAMITGAGISVGGIIAHQLKPDFPINGQEFWAIGMAVSLVVYAAVSLLGREAPHDLDRLLHRGRFAVADDAVRGDGVVSRLQRLFLFTPEFSRRDKVFYLATYAWTFFWFALFLVGTAYNLTHDVADASWARFWRWYVGVQFLAAAAVFVWFTCGGVADLRRMFARLRALERDAADDGIVRG
ncbi:MAG: sodium:solute symporter [Candidatus Krumholzibacteriia bacterium]